MNAGLKSSGNGPGTTEVVKERQAPSTDIRVVTTVTDMSGCPVRDRTEPRH